MARFNTDVVFIDASGQVRTLIGDLTLRANPNGDGHIIAGSGISLRPEVNCDALDAMDLGQEELRWNTLFACGGNFLNRPTVNGSGVVLQGEIIVSKSISIEDPTASEDISLFHADTTYTITKMTVVLIGSASQTVTWTVRKNNDRSATGTEVVTGGTVTTDITTGQDVTTFNSDAIASDDFVWLETTAQGGTVTEMHLTIHMVKTSV